MPIREAGQVLGGKYRLANRLGSGGMGSVWRAEHLTLSSPVAIKLIEPATARESDALHRFLREARTAAALRSPHVVQILDYGVDGDSPYIVMELLDGESLAERLERQTRLSPPETARIIQHVARALSRAHEAGIVHRDLKPENVFIVKNDDEEIAKVLDFGIVKADPNTFGTGNSGAATRTGTLLGTPYFMSPEQAEGAKSVDFRADVWALGVIAYRCLIGKLPFNGDSVGRLILEICSRPLPVPSQRGEAPDGFDAWFARACARDPSDRFESAKRAAAELSRLTEGAASSPSETPRPSQLEPLALASTTLKSSSTEVLPRARRRPRPLALALAAIAALSVLVTISIRLVGSSNRAAVERSSPTLQEGSEALETSASAAGSPASSDVTLLPAPTFEPSADSPAPTEAPSSAASEASTPEPAAPSGDAVASKAPMSTAPPPPEPAPASTAQAASGATPAPPAASAKPLPRKPVERKRPSETPAKPKIDLGI